MDFMAGYVYKKIKLFVYSKFDNTNNKFIGPRLDFDTKFLNNRMLLHAQYKYFWGLNVNSKDHQYLVGFIEYDPNKFLNPRIFGFNKQTFKGDTFLFYGPSIGFKLSKNMYLLM